MTAKEFGQREMDRLKDAKWEPSAVELVGHIAESVAREAVADFKRRTLIACWFDSTHTKAAHCSCGECAGRTDVETAIQALS